MNPEAPSCEDQGIHRAQNAPPRVRASTGAQEIDEDIESTKSGAKPAAKIRKKIG